MKQTMTWAGLDVHVRSTHAAAVDARSGELVRWRGFVFQLGDDRQLSRMGLQKGYGRDKVAKMVRVGTCYDHDPNASEPGSFHYEVGNRIESWGEGMTMIHNPHAVHPVDEAWFPNTAHTFGDEPLIYAHIPPFHPIASKTVTIVARS